MSVTWLELLDSYEARVAAVERAVAAGEVPVVDDWRVPAGDPVGPPTPAERERFMALQARVDGCVIGLREAMTEAEAAIATTRRRGRAARAYGDAERRPD